MKSQGFAFNLMVAAAALVCHPAVRAQDWNVTEPSKGVTNVPEEKSIERRRVTIVQRTTYENAPSFSRDRVNVEAARKIRLEEKTNELIQQLEALIKRQGQAERVGELKMRLAELYFERAQATANVESESWDKAVAAWEKSKQGPRPVLKTPGADRLRNQALNLYSDLERMSRGGDMGRRRLIRRDEVLFFLSATLSELGRTKAARPYYEELVTKFPTSPRTFAARLALADILFDAGEYAHAIPHYLRTAAGEAAPTDAGQEIANLKSYALYKLAWCYENTAAYGKAVLAFERTLDASKQSSSDQRIAFEKEALNDLSRAFAMAGQYKEGEEWFEKSGYGSAEVMEDFYRNVAEVARDRGQWAIAVNAIDKVLKANPKGSGSRDLALDKVKMIGKQGHMEAYAKALAQFAKDYGQGSEWLGAQDLNAEEKQSLVAESVGEIRREAKAYHHIAQQRDKIENYRAARPFYEAYFAAVPDPNPDTAENMHEMRFYYAELLYKIGDDMAAAKAYGEVGAGKYAAAASYSKILALKGAADKDKSAAKDLIAATQEFIDKNPTDERAGELLYASAYESFHSGNYDESLKTLHELIKRFPDKDKGVESADRILFICEKKGDLKNGILEANSFLANAPLLAAGGKDFEKRVRDYRSRAEFKEVENMPESNPQEQALKAQRYRGLSALVGGELREKALNNASVYARKAGDTAGARAVDDQILREFPASKYAKAGYLEKAETLLKEARWPEALAEYNAYLKIHGNEKDETTESAMWNRIYVSSRLEGFWQPELEPARAVSPAVLASAREFLERFPKTKNRGEIITLLAFHKGAKPEDLNKLRKVPGLDAKDKAAIDEAAIVLRVRANNLKDLAALVKANPPAKATTELLKDALGRARFETVEKLFKEYSAGKLNYKPNRFAASLQDRVNRLQKLDKEYTAVVAYGSAEPALKSLERLSKLYRGLASDIAKAPVTKEEAAQLAAYTKPLEDKGLGFLRTCLDKATEYKIAGAGVAACREAALQSGVEKSFITYEVIPDPRWIPQSQSTRPLLKAEAVALGQNQFGEFHLAMGLLEKAEPPLSVAEKAELSNLTGLAETRLKENQSAVRIFRQVADAGGADLAALRTAAMKNLAALYLQVYDFKQAQDVLSSMPDGDVDVAWMRSLSLQAQGKSREAADALTAVLAANPGNSMLWFNKGLAAASAGDFNQAVSAMNRYVEMETPAGLHVSRTLLREWKAKVTP